MIVRVITTAATLMFLAADAFSADSMPAQSQLASGPVASQPAIAPAGPIHVALLEAEYNTPDTRVARGELTAWLEAVQARAR